MINKTGKVYITGAGCGEYNLITLRALEALSCCDVIIYDDLIDENILSFASSDAEKIYMGKRLGKHSASQDDICNLLITKAKEGKQVLRLKGGDPFVFGRGGEEIIALQKNEIPFEEIPGISSCIAIPAMAGIPVTHRNISRSFHVITAHTSDSEDGLPTYFDNLAKIPGTLIILMGLSKLKTIAERLIKAGMPKDTPAAVISGGNSPNPMTVRGKLSIIYEQSIAANMMSPAIIVIGEVAALDLTDKTNLSMPTVGITGTISFQSRLKADFRKYGIKPVLLEEASVSKKFVDLHSLNFEIGRKCLVFTSANGVDVFFNQLIEQEIDIRLLSSCRFAVIGKATGNELKKHSIIADICPSLYTVSALSDTLINSLHSNEEVILLRSESGDPMLSESLAASGYTVSDIHLYSVHATQKKQLIDTACHPDYITFSSAGTVREFFEIYGNIPAHIKCVCIGEPTAAAVRLNCSNPVIVSKETSSSGIVQAIIEDYYK